MIADPKRGSKEYEDLELLALPIADFLNNKTSSPSSVRAGSESVARAGRF